MDSLLNDTAPPLESLETPKAKRGRHSSDCVCDKCTARKANAKPPIEGIRSAWMGIFLIIEFLAGFLGYECDVKSLPESEATEDAQIFISVPGIARFQFLMWIGAPFAVIARIAKHFHVKKPLVKKDTANAPTLRQVP